MGVRASQCRPCSSQAVARRSIPAQGRAVLLVPARRRSERGALHDRNARPSAVASSTRSDERRSCRTASASSSARCSDRHTALTETCRGRSRAIAHSVYARTALGEQRPCKCQHERDEEQNAQRQQQPVAQCTFACAASRSPRRTSATRTGVLRRIRARHRCSQIGTTIARGRQNSGARNMVVLFSGRKWPRPFRQACQKA